MRYKNQSENTLRFEMGGGHYEVPPGGLVEIEGKWDYAVGTRQMPLAPAADDEPGKVVRAVYSKGGSSVRMPTGVELAEMPAGEADDDDEGDVAADAGLMPSDVQTALKKGKKK